MFQPFNFVFYRGNSWISRIIKLFTKGQYSHVALMLDHIHILQTDYKTPVSIQHFNYKSKSYDVYELAIELTEQQKKLLIDYIKVNLSDKYDWKYIITRALNILFGTPVIKSKGQVNCDELIVDGFREKLGIDLLDPTVLLSPTSLSTSRYLKKLTAE
ncbi:hypothetical protein [Heyndrickxia acidicola]|uniref:Uncharacterized protein n=1 Tax=Heyndrickxia acidicola TaxID=209389 RepID=A0ABU6MBP3_9BACI|nr:hypothetical protein [Heyndrickxia acidicola]MED1201935.1 hypothetical protein [Heyndrickxia acidicola]